MVYEGVTKMKNQVCRDCSERTVNCHSTCERYQKERREREIELMKKRDDYQKRAVTHLYIEEKRFRGKR